MIRDMTINGYHTRRDLGLVLTTHPVPAQPAPNVYMIDIPGGNGFIDLTQSLTGETTYSSRTGSWAFTMLCEPEYAAHEYSEIASKFHGQTCRIVLDDDPDYYYEGLLNVGPLALFGNHGAFNVSYTLYPFKYAATETVITRALAARQDYGHVVNMTDRSAIKVNTVLYSNTGVSFASATNVYVNFPSDGYRLTSSTVAHYSFEDSAGHSFTGQQSYSVIQSGNYTIGWTGSSFITACTQAGVDYNNIVRVTVSNWGGCTVSVRENYNAKIELTGGDHGITPTIILPQNNMTVVYNGKAYVGLSSGKQVIDGLIIQKGDSEITFICGNSTSVSGNVQIKYRKEFL